MKRLIILLFLIVFTTFILAGCSITNAYNEVSNDTKYIKNRSKDIIKCFDNRDSETLKKMFCKKTQSEHDLDKEIKAAFDMYSGKSVSYEHSDLSVSGGTDSGKWIDKHFSPQIRKIYTDTENNYEIGYFEYSVNEDFKDEVGIVVISLEDKDGKLLARIG